jgi:hypothetical protein
MMGFASLNPSYALYLRIFASAGSISPDRKTTGHVSQPMFHDKEIAFQRLRKPHEKIRRSCLTFFSAATNCATVSLSKGAF